MPKRMGRSCKVRKNIDSTIAEPHPTSAPCVLSIEYTDRPLYYMMDSTIFVMIFIMDEWEKSSYWYFYRFMINS